MSTKGDSGQGRILPGEGGFGQGSKHDNKVTGWVDSQNQVRVLPMSKMQRDSMQSGTECYIYNVSPIFEFTRRAKGLGEFTFLKKQKKDDRWGPPAHIPHSFANTADGGRRRHIPFVEDGIEIAEGLVGNSKDYPTNLRNPNANLTNFGIVVLYGQKMEDLSQAEQDALYVEAKTKHDTRCQEMVAKADILYDEHPSWICETHRQCLMYLDSEGLLVGGPRRWSNRVAVKDKQPAKECPFCGHENKVRASKCANCKEVIDHKLHEETKKAIKEAAGE